VQTLTVLLRENRLHIGERFSLSLQRTLRIPDDGRTYPLPPGLGRFPIHAASDYRGRVPGAWGDTEAYFIPLYQREALWIGFDAAPWKPNAVKVGTGGVNAVSGGRWQLQLHGDPQDYLVCPPQLWLDGINAGQGVVRQFVAVPLGLGYTVEAQVTGGESQGGIQFFVYEPKLGRFPAGPQRGLEGGHDVRRRAWPAPGAEMGLGAGGRMSQKIYPDPYGLGAWDPDLMGTAVVHLVNSEQYRAITGQTPPPTPINAQTYTAHGLPWFELYDEDLGDVAPPDVLARVRSIDAMARSDGSALPVEEPINVAPDQIRRLGKDV
jgi:hypothetical protein